MSENLPLKKEEQGIFSKIKNFFKRLFSKKEESNNVLLQDEELIVSNNTNDKKEIFNQSLTQNISDKKEVISKMDKSSLVKEFEDNPKLLNNLSYERLEKLHTYYNEVIEDLKSKVNGKDEMFNNMSKDEFIKELESNTDLLNNLSIERLEKLKDYYAKVIKEYKNKLAA